MSDQNLIADLARAGLDPELLQRVVLELARAQATSEALTQRRTADRERQAKRRKGAVSRDITGQPVTSQPPHPSLDGRPSPPAPPHPTLNPSPTPGSEPSGSADGEGEPAGCGQAEDEELDHRGTRRELMRRGVFLVKAMTGRSDHSARQFIGHCLGLANDEAATVLARIEEADQRELVDPTTWIVAQLRARRDQGREQHQPRPAYQPAPTGQAARLATLYRQRQERAHASDHDNALDLVVIDGGLADNGADDGGDSGGPGGGPARPSQTDRRPSDPLQRAFLSRADHAAAQAALRRRRAP